MNSRPLVSTVRGTVGPAAEPIGARSATKNATAHSP
jgi:hypothetical protein